MLEGAVAEWSKALLGDKQKLLVRPRPCKTLRNRKMFIETGAEIWIRSYKNIFKIEFDSALDMTNQRS